MAFITAAASDRHRNLRAAYVASDPAIEDLLYRFASYSIAAGSHWRIKVFNNANEAAQWASSDK